MIHFQIDLGVKGNGQPGSSTGNFAAKRQLRTGGNRHQQTLPPADPLESIPILE